ncbi:MAG: hypothetical protein PHX30_04345 [Candidatus Pacebacteria bacterium]|nr:hypothetical protein [Candidatus Paceibacterota bacterium]
MKSKILVALIGGLIFIASFIFDGSRFSIMLPFVTWAVGFATSELINKSEEGKQYPLVYIIIAVLYLIETAGVIIRFF